jgi:nitrite reductase/ring-hydroxylating ferredoxin subunit
MQESLMSDTRERRPDPTGRAYGRPRQSHNATLTEVGPGTPCGEFMRRYWQPVGLSSKTNATPQAVRILGEDLVLFRDRTGRPGLLYSRCMHRGTTLYYGKVEDRGIRCCYHGWLFDVEGNCLEQPCEPNGGSHRELARQPWYPVEERYGVVFAYMGPPEKQPVLPRYDILEDLAPGEYLDVDDQSWAASVGSTMPIVPHSWLHHYDNIMDPFHVQVLHSTFSGTQFVPEFAVMPKCDFSYTDTGMAYVAHRELDDGRLVDRVSQSLLPNIRIVPNTQLVEGRAGEVAWLVPVDDTHHRIIHIAKVTGPGRFAARAMFNGKRWPEMTEEEHQRHPGDYEAQMGMGEISLHSEEHLATSDRGVAMLRRQLEQQIRAVAEGGDPLGVTFDPEKSVVKVESGNYFR